MRIRKSIACLFFGLVVMCSSVVSADTVSQPNPLQSSVHVIQMKKSLHFRGGLVHVGYTKKHPEFSEKVIVVNKLATYWIKSLQGNGRVRVTVPVRYYLSSWDVKALERELERLGIKVKPKPVPKPGPVISG